MPTNIQQLILMLSCFLVLFSLSLLALATLPGHAQQACLVGSNFTAANLIYNLLMSLGLSYLIVKPFFLQASKFSLAGILSALAFGSTTFCGVCVFPLLSVAGLSSILFFLSTYDFYIKIIVALIVVYGICRIQVIQRRGCRLK